MNHKDRNKSFGIMAAVLILASTCLLSADLDSTLKFKENSWDFGRTKQGKTLTHVFKFTNTGTDILKIARVTSSCGCTAALVSKESLSPGEDGEIKVTFNTVGYEGEVTKYIFIETNDTADPRKQISVSASIDVPPRPKVELDTYSIDLGLVLEGDTLTADTKIKNRGELELTVSLNHRDAKFFRKGKPVEAALKIPSKKEENIEIKIPSTQRKGLIREYVLLQTNDSTRPNLSLYISGYIVSREQLKELFSKYKNILDK